MHSTSPLVRKAAAVIPSSSSRIPHLKFHILQQRTKPLRSAQACRHPSFSVKRSQSTTARTDSSHSFQVRDDREYVDARAPSAHKGTSSSNELVDSRLEDEKVKERDVADEASRDVNFFEIVEQGNPELVLQAFLDDEFGLPFVRYASDEHFEKALLLLEPSEMIEPFKRVHRYLKHSAGFRSPYRLLAIDARLQLFRDLFDTVITARREIGNRLTLNVYRHVLKWAAYLGDKGLAKAVLDHYMRQDEVKPDIHCYNWVLQAKIWNNAFSRAEAFELRVDRRRLEIRASRNPPLGLSGHQVAKEDGSTVGIRGGCLEIFQRIVADDLVANESTFVNLMVAMGREGDLRGVNSILKSVWNINVDLLEKFDEDEIQSPTFYDHDSPLRPTEDLLFAVVHIFGSNNDAATAWLLLDYLSRSYSLEIPQRVWIQLLEWYMVLSMRRGVLAREGGRNVGKISPNVFEHLYNLMTDIPYSVEPDMVISYILSRVRCEEQNLGQQVQALRQLREQFEICAANLKPVLEDMQVAVNQLRGRNFTDMWRNLRFAQLRRKFILDSVEYEAALSMIRQAVCQHLLRAKSWRSNNGPTDWERRHLPTLVDEFLPYVPGVLDYRTSGGHVYLRRDHTFEASVANNALTAQQKRLRRLLDTEDLYSIWSDVQTLSDEELGLVPPTVEEE